MRNSCANTKRSFATFRSWASSALSISLQDGRFAAAPYATQSVWSMVAGGDARKESESERGRRKGVVAPLPTYCDVDGGGVISEEEDFRGAGERSLSGMGGF